MWECDLDMFNEQKNLAVALLLVLALVLAYFILNNSYQDKIVEPQVFLMSLKNSTQFYIIQDLRGSNDDLVRKNIMQCGVDIAGSQGIAALNKTITIYALEEDNCLSIDGKKPLSDCINPTDGTIFHIKNGNQTNFYQKKLEIGIGAIYTLKSCNIKVSSNFTSTT